MCSCGASILRVDYDLVCSDCGSVQEGRYDPDEGLAKGPSSSRTSASLVVAYIYKSNLYKSSRSNYSGLRRSTTSAPTARASTKYMKKGLSHHSRSTCAAKGMGCITRCSSTASSGRRTATSSSRRAWPRGRGTWAACLRSGGDQVHGPDEAGHQLRHELPHAAAPRGQDHLRPAQGITRARRSRRSSPSSRSMPKRATPLGLAVMDVIDTMKVNNIGASLHTSTPRSSAPRSASSSAQKELESRQACQSSAPSARRVRTRF